ncbi:Zinc finger, RING-type [Corchorus olitorius]|uniref:Zinc finger, RING-type n=1 Tax=Corchorus olitorius TaxID=93759 RepID=A0A1R3K699_9ROSI|nr:Zinc finger, RING-type [Corchorus olitorius]
MGAISEFFSHLYTMTIVFFTLLLLEVVILIRSLTGGVCDSEKRLITTTQYLKFIEEKNPTIRYSKRSSSSSASSSRSFQESNECAVCLSELEEGEKVRKLKCKHTFHKDCLDKWLQQYWATCPLCRTKVLPDEIVANYHRLQNQVEYDGSDEEMIFLLSALHGNSLHRLF